MGCTNPGLCEGDCSECAVEINEDSKPFTRADVEKAFEAGRRGSIAVSNPGAMMRAEWQYKTFADYEKEMKK